MNKPVNMIALMMLLALAGACSGATESKQAEAPPPRPTYVGEVIQARDAELTVTEVTEREAVGPDFMSEQASEGGVLIAVRYSIKNVSAKPMKSYAAPTLTLIDPGGIEYKPDVGKSGSYAAELDLDQKIFSDLNPGITTRGATVFEVSAEAFDPATWALIVNGDKDKRIALTDPPPIPEPAAAPVTLAPTPEVDQASEAASPVAASTPGIARSPIAAQPPPAATPRQEPLPDYSRRERRLTMLIENASQRDATGAVLDEAARARRERDACSTRACVERSYARQEAQLRNWDGSDEVMAHFR